MFLRKAKRREPVPVTMSGVRMGERLLQVGLDDPVIAGMIAAKIGLSGSASAAVRDAQEAGRMRESAAEAGALVEVQETPLGQLPFGDAAFDVVVLHTVQGLLSSLAVDDRLAALRECYRVLRHGGRLVAIEAGTRGGMATLLRRKLPAGTKYATEGGTTGALGEAGFRPVRLVGDVEGFRFVEGLKS